MIYALRAFLSSLLFWRWRARYGALCDTCNALERRNQALLSRVNRAVAEITRLQRVLAPYGETILRGQSDDTGVGPIMLPRLELEMAKAHLFITSRTGCPDEDLYMPGSGFTAFSWCGRRVQLRAEDEGQTHAD